MNLISIMFFFWILGHTQKRDCFVVAKIKVWMHFVEINWK